MGEIKLWDHTACGAKAMASHSTNGQYCGANLINLVHGTHRVFTYHMSICNDLDVSTN